VQLNFVIHAPDMTLYMFLCSLDGQTKAALNCSSAAQRVPAATELLTHA